jgi:Uma2 family endonuclease
MVQTPLQPITLEAFVKLPETKPAREFIDGITIQKPMPQGKHSTIQGDLVQAVNAVLKPDRIGRAYPELRCTYGGRSTVPDISVFTWQRIPRTPDGKVANSFEAAPDWTIEILSPGQSQSKVVSNIMHCIAHGTHMGWLIDPEEEMVFIYLADRTIAIFEAANDLLLVPTFANGLQLTVGELFGWLEE